MFGVISSFAWTASSSSFDFPVVLAGFDGEQPRHFSLLRHPICVTVISYIDCNDQMRGNGKGFVPMERFLWLANWPALDFVNTEIMQFGKRIDLFRTGKDVTDWLRAAGLSSASLPATFEEGLLKDARDYRKCLRGAFEKLGSSGQIPAHAISATNRLLDGSRFRLRLQHDGGEFWLEKRWNFTSAADQLIPVALSFAELLSTGDLSRVRGCNNPECILFFYDTSKSATRAWCSLDNCGNKLRMAAFRQRHRA